MCAIFAISDDILRTFCNSIAHYFRTPIRCNRETMTCTGKQFTCNEVSVYFIDGTVKCFLIMYDIHGLCNRHYVPLVLVLLPGKSESIYCSMWSAVRSFCERRNLTLEPITVHIDFQVVMHTVLKNVQCTINNQL